MILKKLKKQPRESKDYDVDFAPWLSPTGDALDDVVVEVLCLDDPEDTALEVFDVQLTASKAKLWVRGGTDGYAYKVTLLASSVGQRIDESEVIFAVGDI